MTEIASSMVNNDSGTGKIDNLSLNYAQYVFEWVKWRAALPRQFYSSFDIVEEIFGPGLA